MGFKSFSIFLVPKLQLYKIERVKMFTSRPVLPGQSQAPAPAGRRSISNVLVHWVGRSGWGLSYSGTLCRLRFYSSELPCARDFLLRSGRIGLTGRLPLRNSWMSEM